MPHEAVPEVSKGKAYINQNKNAPIQIGCDMFEHVALRETLFLNTLPLPLSEFRELIQVGAFGVVVFLLWGC